MKNWIASLMLATLLISCKSKKDAANAKDFFPVVSFLKGQVKEMEQRPLTFTRVQSTDNGSDTSKISREEFRTYAKQFLDLPDIASPQNVDDYKVTKDFDETLGNVLLIYTPTGENKEVTNETVILAPGQKDSTRVQTIIVSTQKEQGDSVIEKNMTWHIDRRFQVVTKVSRANQPEKISTVAVQWE